MENKNPVEWLIGELLNTPYLTQKPDTSVNGIKVLKILNQANEMFKEQIIETWNKRGSTIVPRYFLEENIDGEEYYKQKYGKG